MKETEQFNYNKLKGKIKECYGTQTKFARAMGISPVSLSKKLNNKVQFEQYEINHSCRLLDLSLNDIHIYFFNLHS